MPVTVRIPSQLRQLARGERLVSVEAATTVGALIDALEARFPGLRSRLVDADGSIYPFVNVFVDGQDVRLRSGLDTPLDDGDELVIVPAMAGG
jgi:sulfur-carrier protein